MIFKIGYLLFASFMTLRAISHWRRREWRGLGRSLEMMLWWLGAVFVIFPESTQSLADLLGIGRGVDAILYIAVIFAYKLVFNQMQAVRRLEREITLLTREVALREGGAPSGAEVQKEVQTQGAPEREGGGEEHEAGTL